MSDDAVEWSIFYEAIGRGITAWALVENALCDLFSRAVICSIKGSIKGATFEMHWVVGNVFNSITNLPARLKMIDDTLNRVVSDPDILTEWSAVRNKVGTNYPRRNALAHGAVWGNDGGASVLGYPLFSSKEQIATYKQVCEWQSSFKKLEDRVTDLAIKVNKHVAERWAAAGGQPPPPILSPP